MWVQREITLRSRPRGFHLVTREVLEGIPFRGDRVDMRAARLPD